MTDLPQLENFTSATVRAVKAPQIILFGSRWLGNARLDSDVDLVVVSESFHATGLAERHRMMERAILDLGWRHHDIILRSPKDWAKPNWLRDAVESQVNERDVWRGLFERVGKFSVLQALNRARVNATRAVLIGDIAAELASVPTLKPVPREDWPLWAKMVAAFAKAGDVGVGDTVHRLAVGARDVLAFCKVPCGCDRRQAEMNATMPYQPGEAGADTAAEPPKAPTATGRL